jgi:hypothetical protein
LEVSAFTATLSRTRNNVANSEFYQALSSTSSYNQEPVFQSHVPVPELPWKTSPTKEHLSGTSNAGEHQLVEVSGPEARTVYIDGSGEFQ